MQGAPCQGMLWQTKRLEVLQHLQQQRVIPLAVRRCAVKQSLWHPRYSCETIRQLASLLQASLPLAEGLSLLAQQQSHAQWQALLEALGRELAQGVAFSAALAQWPQAFPPLYLAMISTGELTGKLDICCLQLANQQQEQQRRQQSQKSAALPADRALSGAVGGAGDALFCPARVHRHLPDVQYAVTAVDADGRCGRRHAKSRLAAAAGLAAEPAAAQPADPAAQRLVAAPPAVA
ncbi:unnamed protein product [Klebsiella pneumoniae subsp. rhinoscleromatis SB3432]|nr:unnamed protein product [Klebsiella pneumoniae subsp. rhinoscleromatis SB3432]